jgi:diguanylate cyclase (GGDEF)-like protein/PAS domain S-box-containing protein
VTRFPGEGPVRIAVAHENITERKLAEDALIVSEAQLRTHQIELEMQNEQLLQTQTELEDARARYLDLYELAPVGYLMLRENGTILEANLTAENMIGAERGKLAEQLLGKFILPEDQDIFYLCRIKLFETGAPKGCEFRMLKNDDGTQFWVRLQMTIAKGADNTPICRVVLSDITKRKQVELEILAAQNQLEATLNAIPDLLFELGLDGCYYNYHSPRSDLLAAPPEIFMGKTIFEILPANAAQIVMAGLQETHDKGHSTGKQFELQLPQGNFWFELSISRKATEPGQEVRFIVLSRDITKRKQADVELRKLSQAVEQSANSIMVTDIEGNIAYTNPKFTTISGYSLTEVMGKNPRILSSGEHSHELYQNLWQTIKSGKIWHEQLHNKRKDGTLYWDDTTIAPVYDSTGKMVSFIAIKEDITARKLLEEAERDHRQLAEALRDTAMALNSTLELNEILDRILANIGMLMKYDTAMVLLIEENTVRKMRYHINPQNTINLLPIGDVQASLLNVPILKKIIQTKQSYLIPDIHKDARWQTVTIPDMQQIRSLVCVPIESHGNVVGVINIISATPDFFTPLHTERVMAFASQAAIAFENARLFEHAQQLSLTDPLTDLYNMRYFANVAKTEFERNQRYERTLSVAMMNIDHFKTINDTYGHVMGDFALTEIAARIKKAVRTVDTVARYGGDEFIVLMPETDMEEACQVAERIRQIVADGPIENEDAVISVTLSLGIAEMNKNIKSLDELIKLADQALYEC